MSPAKGTFTTEAAVELAVLERSGFVESRHSGSAVVLNPDGTVRRKLGDVRAPIFPRSALKPFQTLASMASGAELVGQEIVLATASHSGTSVHATIVRDILRKGSLPLSSLGCPAAWPDDSDARDDLIRDGHKPHPIFMTCSGKHAAMLLACRANGWDLKSYLDPSHPLQARVREVVQRFSGEQIQATGVDGCGAPVYAISLTGLASGYSRIASASPDSPWPLYRDAARLVEAVIATPWLISGRGEADDVAIEELGVLAKVGWEGVVGMAAPDGTTVAVKILDGSLRAAVAVAVQLLRETEAVDRGAVERTLGRLDLSVHGGSDVVGRIRVTAV